MLSPFHTRYHPEVVQVSVSFRGRVQGVGFRATTQSIARSFKVTGWVRNEADGSVSLLAEGEPGEIDAFLAAIHQRMERHIISADRQNGQPTGVYSRFEIAR